MTQLKRTAQAENDLLDLWTFIAADSIPSADKLIRDLNNRSQQLLSHPEMSVLREDIAPELRHLSHKNYLILYRIVDEDIEIVRYLNGARDLQAL